MQLTQDLLRGNERRLPPSNIIIFGSIQEDPLQTELLNSLQQHSFLIQLQPDLTRLSQVLSQTKSNQLLLLLTNIYSEDAVLEALGSKEKLHQLKTYPYRIPALVMTNFSTISEVIQACQSLKKKSGRRGGSIRLSGVHSINKSYSSSKSITKVSSESHYQSLFYYRNNDYGSQDSPLYEQIIDILSKDNSYYPFIDLSNALKQINSNSDKKVLVVCPSRLTEEVSKALKKKNKQSNTDLLLIGPLHPNKYILSQSVVLASESPYRVYQYLKDKNMVSPQIVSVLFEQLIRNFKTKQEVLPEFTGYGPEHNEAVHSVVSNFFERIGSPQQALANSGQKAQQNKHKIKKMKSPTKSRPSEVASSERKVGQSENQVNNNRIDIQVSEPRDQPILQTQEFYTNKQGERLKKSQSLEDGKSTPDIAYPLPIKSHHFETGQEIRSGISKFRSPSTVIHQTSDEYRGSNKESIVNFEPEAKNEVERVPKVIRKEETSQPEEVRNESEHVIEESFSKTNLVNSPQKRNDVYSYTNSISQNGTNRNPIIHSKWQNGLALSQTRLQSSNINPLMSPSAKVNHQDTILSKQILQINHNPNIRTIEKNHYEPSLVKSSPSKGNQINLSTQVNSNSINSRGIIQVPSLEGTPTIKYNSTNLNLQGFERVEVNGIVMYRKKQIPHQTTNNQHQHESKIQGLDKKNESRYLPYTIYNSGSGLPESHDGYISRDMSPKVVRYEVSPRRQAQNNDSQPMNGVVSRSENIQKYQRLLSQSANYN